MGTDCHILIQVFDIELNQWVLVQRTLHDPSNPSSDNGLKCITSGEYYKLTKEHEKCKEIECESDNEKCCDGQCNHVLNECECFDDFRIHFHVLRNYDFFAKIANVRNYRHVEGIEAKGVPDDLDHIVRKIIIDDDDNKSYKYLSPLDLHSHTYFYDYEVDEMEMDNRSMDEFKELLTLVRNNFHNKQIRFLICFDN